MSAENQFHVVGSSIHYYVIRLLSFWQFRTRMKIFWLVTSLPFEGSLYGRLRSQREMTALSVGCTMKILDGVSFFQMHHKYTFSCVLSLLAIKHGDVFSSAGGKLSLADGELLSKEGVESSKRPIGFPFKRPGLPQDTTNPGVSRKLHANLSFRASKCTYVSGCIWLFIHTMKSSLVVKETLSSYLLGLMLGKWKLYNQPQTYGLLWVGRLVNNAIQIPIGTVNCAGQEAMGRRQSPSLILPWRAQCPYTNIIQSCTFMRWHVSWQ